MNNVGADLCSKWRVILPNRFALQIQSGFSWSRYDEFEDIAWVRLVETSQQWITVALIVVNKPFFLLVFKRVSLGYLL